VVNLEHKNVITFFNKEMDDEKKYFYLCLGYCEGTLKDVIDVHSKIPAKIEKVRSDPAKENLIKLMQKDRKESGG